MITCILMGLGCMTRQNRPTNYRKASAQLPHFSVPSNTSGLVTACVQLLLQSLPSTKQRVAHDSNGYKCIPTSQFFHLVATFVSPFAKQIMRRLISFGFLPRLLAILGDLEAYWQIGSFCFCVSLYGRISKLHKTPKMTGALINYIQEQRGTVQCGGISSPSILPSLPH